MNESDDNTTVLPDELTFNADSVQEIVVYSFLLAVASAGNIPVFVILLRNNSRRKSRIKLMILNLAVADLIVTIVMIPLEISWRITVAWIAGNAACKVLLFLRAFGPYLSSMVLVCISVDRYFAILHPLKVSDAQRRSKIMLFFAWLISFFCSVPQSIVFHVESHPEYPEFLQCVSFNFFPSPWHNMVYNMFCLMVLYGVPLLIILYCYSCILYVILMRSKGSSEELATPKRQTRQYPIRLQLRRSHMVHIERARTRTLRMTIVIVLAFFWCWTPYVVIVLWYQFDTGSAKNLDPRLQSSLFMFAVSNSCVNPIVYGSYAANFKQIFRRCFPSPGKESIEMSRQFSRGATHVTTVESDLASSSQNLGVTSALVVSNGK